MRSPPARRDAARGVGTQALPFCRRHQPAPARACQAGRGLHAASGIRRRLPRGTPALRAPASDHGHGRERGHRRTRSRRSVVDAGRPRDGGDAGVARPGRFCAEGRRAGRLPRCRAHLDRHLRARRGAGTSAAARICSGRCSPRSRSAMRLPPVRPPTSAGQRAALRRSEYVAVSTEIFNWMVRNPDHAALEGARQAEPRAPAPAGDGRADAAQIDVAGRTRGVSPT